MVTLAANDEEPKGADTDVSSTGSSNEDSAPEAQSFKKLMTETKVEGGKSAWATTLETLGMAHGEKKKKGDVELRKNALQERKKQEDVKLN